MLLCKTSSSIVSVFALLSIAFTIGAAAPAPTLARPPIVKTNSGDIQGSVATSFLDRRTYYSFRGIPFAQPPIGHLRFKAPQKIEPWSGVLNASEYGAQCLQTTFSLTDFEGAEDCLFLNVYTPNLSGQEKLPVIFYIHGGGYMSGSSDWMGPEILLDEDIVLVTTNYRLGPFGFLSLNLPEYSGNMGLKDQLLALRWVNENIASFGGDRNKITLYGQSAGASAVHLYTLIPAARNLFQRAIIGSGSMLNPWSCSTANHTEIVVKQIAKENGVNENDVQMKEIVEWLQTVNGNRFGVQTFSQVYESSKSVKEIDLIWAPVIEKENDVDAIFTRPIESYLQDKTDIDTLFGYTSAEAIIIAPEDINNVDGLKSFDENFAVQLPLYDLNYTYSCPEYKEIMKDVRKYYFGDKSINRDTLTPFIRLLDDVFFFYGIDKSARAQATRSTGKTFYYQFSVELELNFLRKEANASTFGLSGATHIEDMFYLFKLTAFVPKGGYDVVKPNSREAQMIRTMTKFIRNFAKNGDPAPNSEPTELKPIQSDTVNYVDITNTGFFVDVNPHSESIRFWDELLSAHKDSLKVKF